MRKLLSLCLILSSYFNLTAQISGFVYEDSNGNQVKDKNEKGIPKVSVSNQLTVVKTDENGFYKFDTTEHLGTISISLPMGYKGNIWQAIANHPEQIYNFPLIKTPAKNKFTFIHASDTHIQPNNRHRIQRFRAKADSLNPDFIIVTGDLVKDALRVPDTVAQAFYDLYVEEINQFTMPVWSVPGNHEIFGIERHLSLVSPTHPLYGKKMFRHYLGPEYYSFNYGGVHFIGLNSVSYEDLWYYGDIDKMQLNWLRADIAQIPTDMPVVTFNHIALVSPGFGLSGFTETGKATTLVTVDGVKRYRHIIGNAPQVISILRERPFPLALAGHFHSAQSATFETQGNQTLFSQTSAITGPNSYYFGAMKVTSGFTLFEMENGKVIQKKFIPLN